MDVLSVKQIPWVHISMQVCTKHGSFQMSGNQKQTNSGPLLPIQWSSNAYHTPCGWNIMCQKWEGDYGLWVLNEIILKRYATSLKIIVFPRIMFATTIDFWNVNLPKTTHFFTVSYRKNYWKEKSVQGILNIFFSDNWIRDMDWMYIGFFSFRKHSTRHFFLSKNSIH